MTSVLRRDTQREAGEGHVKTEAEIGMTWPQAKERSGPLEEAGRLFPWNLQVIPGPAGVRTLISDFWPPQP